MGRLRANQAARARAKMKLGLSLTIPIFSGRICLDLTISATIARNSQDRMQEICAKRTQYLLIKKELSTVSSHNLRQDWSEFLKKRVLVQVPIQTPAVALVVEIRDEFCKARSTYRFQDPQKPSKIASPLSRTYRKLVTKLRRDSKWFAKWFWIHRASTFQSLRGVSTQTKLWKATSLWPRVIYSRFRSTPASRPSTCNK